MTDLRQELKAWERGFAERHGRKPGREDIKRDPQIEAKYKAYSHASKPSQDTALLQIPSQGQKRKHAEERVLRERAQNIPASTPRKAMKSLKENVGRDASVEPDPTPAFIRCALGPTPQRDGQVLGIFDMLPSASPSKPGLNACLTGIAMHGMTPTKKPCTNSLTTPSTSTRTPQSSHKRLFLDAFSAITPRHQRGDETPSSAKRQFATPSFLRRNFALAPITEDDQDTGIPPPFRKRSVVRSLSTIIRGLRNQEEERLDEELDILAELEAEERGESVPTKPSRPSFPQILVENSQVVEMPLGPDRAHISDDELNPTDLQGALDANGLPRKVWKKKGLKRQTKRVKMKPVLHRPKKEGALDDVSDGQEEIVAETQLDGRIVSRDEGVDSGDSDADFDGQAVASPSKAKKKTMARKDDKNETSSKKKVNALAHANFRKLKIKNKNSKANGRGRFGRR